MECSKIEGYPRCLTPFRIIAMPSDGEKLDGHPSAGNLGLTDAEAKKIVFPIQLTKSYEMSCTCGSPNYKIHGYIWNNPDFNNEEVFLSPIELECLTCHLRKIAFDSDIHGYDAELGHGVYTVRGKGIASAYTCKVCKGDAFVIQSHFEYPDDVFDGSFESHEGRELDLFTWYTMIGTCKRCTKKHSVASFECA